MRQLRALVVIGALVLAGQAASTYKVRRGDTLSGLAHRFKTTVEALAANNAIANIHRIREGQLIATDGPKPGAKDKPTPPGTNKPTVPLSGQVVVIGGSGTATHQVKEGDNLSDLAKRYGTSVPELRKLNNMKAGQVLRIGRALNVPGTSWACPVNGNRDFGDSWARPARAAACTWASTCSQPRAHRSWPRWRGGSRCATAPSAASPSTSTAPTA